VALPPARVLVRAAQARGVVQVAVDLVAVVAVVVVAAPGVGAAVADLNLAIVGPLDE